MKEVEVILLAGGKGLRMGQLTAEKQKCLLPIDNKPIIGHILESLIYAYGSVDLKVAVSYRDEQVKEFIEHNKPKEMSVTYVPHPLGAGSWGAYKSMENYIRGPFVGISGDIITTPEAYSTAIERWLAEKSNTVVTVSPKLEEAETHGLVRVVGKKVVEFLWPTQNVPLKNLYLRDMSIYASDKRFFSLLNRYPNLNGDVPKVFTMAVANGDIIEANPTEASWIHIGHPQDLNKTFINFPK